MLYNRINPNSKKKGGCAVPRISVGRRRFIAAALVALAAIVLIYAVMCSASGVSPASYKYKSYLLQAQAWLRGETALDQNYEYLELAVYEGKYYVSFPPVPAIPMVLWTLLFGDGVPGGLFQKLYVAAACLIVLSELLRTKRMKWGDCIAWALLLCFASAMLPITLVGGVWYEAQILAFLLGVSAVVAIWRDRPTLACLCYALAVGCRPFSACLGPALLAMYLRERRPLKRLLPGILTGLAIAACYGIYNYARFGNPFEFGHNYLPEFTRSEHGQLSLEYVWQNFKILFFGAPFTADGPYVTINQFGFSMFLSCPVLICWVVWFLKDLLLRRLNAAKLTIIAMATLNVFLLLMHRTLGGLQFGARYALELMPLCLAYLLLSPDRDRLTRWESVLLGFGLIFNLVGGILIHV